MPERLAMLHARMDAVLAATVGVGRIPEPERKPRPSFGKAAHKSGRIQPDAAYADRSRLLSIFDK